jgi:hypothetical protein
MPQGFVEIFVESFRIYGFGMLYFTLQYGMFWKICPKQKLNDLRPTVVRGNICLSGVGPAPKILFLYGCGSKWKT